MSKPHVWFVEERDRGQWAIVPEIHFSFPAALEALRESKHATGDYDNIRVAKYVRVEPRPVETKKLSK